MSKKIIIYSDNGEKEDEISVVGETANIDKILESHGYDVENTSYDIYPDINERIKELEGELE